MNGSAEANAPMPEPATSGADAGAPARLPQLGALEVGGNASLLPVPGADMRRQEDDEFEEFVAEGEQAVPRVPPASGRGRLTRLRSAADWDAAESDLSHLVRGGKLSTAEVAVSEDKKLKNENLWQDNWDGEATRLGQCRCSHELIRTPDDDTEDDFSKQLRSAALSPRRLDGQLTQGSAAINNDAMTMH